MHDSFCIPSDQEAVNIQLCKAQRFFRDETIQVYNHQQQTGVATLGILLNALQVMPHGHVGSLRGLEANETVVRVHFSQFLPFFSHVIPSELRTERKGCVRNKIKIFKVYHDQRTYLVSPVALQRDRRFQYYGSQRRHTTTNYHVVNNLTKCRDQGNRIAVVRI